MIQNTVYQIFNHIIRPRKVFLFISETLLEYILLENFYPGQLALLCLHTNLHPTLSGFRHVPVASYLVGTFRLADIEWFFPCKAKCKNDLLHHFSSIKGKVPRLGKADAPAHINSPLVRMKAKVNYMLHIY